LTAQRCRLRLHGPADSCRGSVERYIQSIYATRYGARICAWAPVLVSLEIDRKILAAAGYRSAAGPLYLERYLARPADKAVAETAAVRVARDEVVEFGHLASDGAGASRQLMLALGEHLAAEGFRWVVSTATRGLRSTLSRLGIRLFVLGPADPVALGDEAASWGTYFEHAPFVVAGEITGSLARLGRGLRR
jgi:hypothetical protein